MAKIKLGEATLYLHTPDAYAKVLHLDVEASVLARIIKPKESTFVGGKGKGVFIGLKKEMQRRARELIKKFAP